MAGAAEGYGGGRLALWAANLRDRLRGAHARANARAGWLRPPPGRGRVLWVRAGAEPRHVRMAVELAGAIRHRRLDVRIALTWEAEQPGLAEARLAGLRRLAWGYGPADAPAAVRRALRRLGPMGVVAVGGVRPRLGRALAGRDVRLAVAGGPPAGGERPALVWPFDADEAEAWTAAGTAGRVLAPADPLTLLVLAQAEPTLRALAGGGERPLWWAHGLAPAEAAAFVAAWRASPTGAGLLWLSPQEPGAAEALAAALPDAARVSAWERTPLPAGAVMVVDDPRWLGALAASAEAVHLASAGSEAAWQALAGGAAVSAAAAARAACPALAPSAARALDAPEAVLAWWAEALAAPGWRRRHGDPARRAFWAARRAAEANLETLLATVYEW